MTSFFLSAAYGCLNFVTKRFRDLRTNLRLKPVASPELREQTGNVPSSKSMLKASRSSAPILLDAYSILQAVAVFVTAWVKPRADNRTPKCRWLVVLLLMTDAITPAIVAAADDPPAAFECRRTEEAILIDGEAKEAAWKTAQEVSPFILPWLDPTEDAKTLTKARLLWDGEALYFFAEMVDTELTAKVEEQDGMTWTDDVFELFFKPDAEGSGYYEFQVNALGTRLDMFIPERKKDLYVIHKSDRKFAYSAKVVLDGTLNDGHDEDKGWRVEGRIPWSDFKATGGKPEIGDQWRFNLCRYDYPADPEVEPELSVIAPEMPKDFHAHEHYAPLTFTGVWDPREGLPEQVQKIRGYDGSKIIGTPEPPPPFTVEPTMPDFRVDRMITFQFEPKTGRILYIDQPPKVKNARLIRYDPNTAEREILLDPPEMIYDLELHPNYPEDRRIFLSFNGPVEIDRYQKRVEIVSFELDPTPGAKLDYEDAVSIIGWPCRGHTGGALEFDADGLFYITSGDGTSDSDHNQTGQKLSALHAKVLRIDVDNVPAGKSYTIPPDNPFLDVESARPETFAYGMRNPWRSDWDHRLGRLWVGNNGQDLLEQAYLVEPGANYGWSAYEGSRPFYPDRERGPSPISLPTVEHDHGESRSLTGGVVYTGDKISELKDAYLYADHTTGKIWAVLHDGEKVVKNWEIADTTLKITEFAVHPETGDALIASHEPTPAGGLYRLVPNPAAASYDPSDFPKKLSDTGLFESAKNNRPRASLLPYDVIVPQWLDGAKSERHVMLPEDDPHIAFGGRRGWTFPDGSVVVQSISAPAAKSGEAPRRIETRILTKQQNEWAAYSYIWNAEQTGAELAPAEGVELDTVVGGQKWKVPSRSECMFCHSRAANFVLGLSTAQINRDFDYGEDFSANQLQVMDDLGFFLRKGAAKRTSTMRGEPADLERLVDPFDHKADLDLRARSYLQASCGHCHVQSGGGNSEMDLRNFVEDDAMKIFGVPPLHGDQGFGADATLVEPGKPAKSVMFKRVASAGVNSGRMPPVGASTPDARAIGLLLQWIQAKNIPSTTPSPPPDTKVK